ncbi:MAG: ATP12 family protein [Hyphomicrobiaceae bacterium]|nr:ATP12 family protein [Hyphomicrobiaceae bacterium]
MSGRGGSGTGDGQGDVRRELGGETPMGGVGGSEEPATAEAPLRNAAPTALPKRFYTSVAVAPAASRGDAPSWRVHLDGRPVRTPGKRILALPARPLAEAIAAEWAQQGAVLDPTTMPLTRLSNTILDGIAESEEAIRADIAAFAMSDLVCYRADGPEELARRQAESWDPIVRWAETRLAAPLVLAAGLMPVAQSEGVREGMLAALSPLDAFRLAPLHVMTTLTGSALVALAVAEAVLDADAAWAAAHVDEVFQESQWGTDTEASTRRARRRAEMVAAARMLDLLRSA